MSDQVDKQNWVIAFVVVTLAAVVIGLASRNAKGKKLYDQLVSAIEDLIEESRDKAEGAADVISDAGEELAKDVERRSRRAKRRLR